MARVGNIQPFRPLEVMLVTVRGKKCLFIVVISPQLKGSSLLNYASLQWQEMVITGSQVAIRDDPCCSNEAWVSSGMGLVVCSGQTLTDMALAATKFVHCSSRRGNVQCVDWPPPTHSSRYWPARSGQQAEECVGGSQ